MSTTVKEVARAKKATARRERAEAYKKLKVEGTVHGIRKVRHQGFGSNAAFQMGTKNWAEETAKNTEEIANNTRRGGNQDQQNRDDAQREAERPGGGIRSPNMPIP